MGAAVALGLDKILTMPKRIFLSAASLLIVTALTNCSTMPEVNQFESENKWFKLTYPASWQVELEDGIYTFTEENDPSWAFQVSAYRATNDTIPNFSIQDELQNNIESHPDAEIVTLPNRKAVYYTKHVESSLLHIWIIGGKRCKTFCSYTEDAPASQNVNFTAAQKAVDSMQIQ